MKRSGSIKRNKPLARGRGVKPVNRERKAERHARNFGAEAEYVRNLPCVITGATRPDAVIVPAHVKSVGAGGGRLDTIPIRWDLHEEQHRIGIDSFAAKYNINPRRLADDIALGMPEPLGIRGLARRFAAWLGVEWPGTPGVTAKIWTGSDAGPVAFADGQWHTRLDPYERGALFGWVDRRAERVWAEQPEAIGESAVQAVLVTELGLSIDAAGDLLDAATEGRP
jgi:hypothetical protein